MAHYAKVEEGIVTQVVVADSIEWCEKNLGGEWIQTSYNTSGGKHSQGKFPIHKNFAGIGFTFDGIGFAQPRPFNSWNLNADTYLWEAPVAMPVEEGKMFTWDEPTISWIETPAL